MPSLNSLHPVQAESICNDTLKPFDIFYDAGQQELALLCAKGQTYSKLPDETQLRDNNRRSLYIRSQDKPKYERYVSMMLKSILGDVQLDVASRSRVAHSALFDSTAAMFDNPNIENVKQNRQTVLEILDFVVEEEDALSNLILCKSDDYDVHHHSINVGLVGMGIVLEIKKINSGIPERSLIPAFFLHDIGKANIPSSILSKKKDFSSIDWKFMKLHPEQGRTILKKCDALNHETDIIVSHHHERNNGSGYPRGLRGNDIHMFARLCAFTDVYDGLTSKRPYKSRHSAFEALTIMKQQMPRDFDQRLFVLFVNLLKELQAA